MLDNFPIAGRVPPGGLLPSQTPQFVVLTFDDAVNGRTLPDYKRLFAMNRFKSVFCVTFELPRHSGMGIITINYNYFIHQGMLDG